MLGIALRSYVEASLELWLGHVEASLELAGSPGATLYLVKHPTTRPEFKSASNSKNFEQKAILLLTFYLRENHGGLGS